jgi:hypothetical protein
MCSLVQENLSKPAVRSHARARDKATYQLRLRMNRPGALSGRGIHALEDTTGNMLCAVDVRRSYTYLAGAKEG